MRRSPKRTPPGVALAVAGEMLAGQADPEEVAAFYGISRQTVEKLGRLLEGIDVARLSALKGAQEGLWTAVATLHGLNAAKFAQSDPKLAVTCSFGGKLAIEAARLAAPQSAKPGMVALTLIQSFHGAPPPANVLEVLPVAESSVQDEGVALPCPSDTPEQVSENPEES